MQEYTLNSLKEKIKDPNESYGITIGGKASYYGKMLHKDASKAVKFILNLRKKGVPLQYIDVSDWSSAPIIVYVKGHKYYRFSDHDLKNALRRVK